MSTVLFRLPRVLTLLLRSRSRPARNSDNDEDRCRVTPRLPLLLLFGDLLFLLSFFLLSSFFGGEGLLLLLRFRPRLSVRNSDSEEDRCRVNPRLGALDFRLDGLPLEGLGLRLGDEEEEESLLRPRLLEDELLVLFRFMSVKEEERCRVTPRLGSLLVMVEARRDERDGLLAVALEFMTMVVFRRWANLDFLFSAPDC